MGKPLSVSQTENFRRKRDFFERKSKIPKRKIVFHLRFFYQFQTFRKGSNQFQTPSVKGVKCSNGTRQSQREFLIREVLLTICTNRGPTGFPLQMVNNRK